MPEVLKTETPESAWPAEWPEEKRQAADAYVLAFEKTGREPLAVEAWRLITKNPSHSPHIPKDVKAKARQARVTAISLMEEEEVEMMRAARAKGVGRLLDIIEAPESEDTDIIRATALLFDRTKGKAPQELRITDDRPVDWSFD